MELCGEEVEIKEKEAKLGPVIRKLDNLEHRLCQ